MTLGVAGSGRFVLLVVLLINLGGAPFRFKPCAYLQRVALVDVEQKEIEGRWAVHAVSEGSDR